MDGKFNTQMLHEVLQNLEDALIKDLKISKSDKRSIFPPWSVKYITLFEDKSEYSAIHIYWYLYLLNIIFS